MNSSWRSCIGVPVLLAACAFPLVAQDEPVRPSPNPYQEDVSYRIGEELAPNVEVDDVRWLLVQVAPREGEELAPEQEATTFVNVSFDNRNRKGTNLIVVLLLEDDGGAELHRLSLPEMRISGNRSKEYRHKVAVPGSALLNTRRMYLFFRVQR